MKEELEAAPAWANALASVTRRLPRAKSTVIDWICRGSDARFLGKMTAELGGYLFDCCLRDMIARHVFFAGCYAAQEVAVLRGVLQPGMTFVDVGADWGLMTLVASHLVGSPGRILALEPDPRAFKKLTRNLERNRLSQVRAFEIAAADNDAELILAGYDEEDEKWPTSRLVDHRSAEQNLFHVRSRQLDPLLDEAGIEAVDLIKIDVEGAEDLVLRGMEPGLTRRRYHRILLELHPLQLAERFRTERDATDLLAAKGYGGYSLDFSASAARRAYYRPWSHFSEFILPLELTRQGRTPHTLWVSPDQPDLI
jgi:FkbM family methyltransferase